MRILTTDGIEIENPDLRLGRLQKESLLVFHHPAIEPVKEEGHYKTVSVYPNGGRDVEWIVDVPGVEAKEAWDEYEDILRYILYTPEELAEIEAKRKPTTEEQIAELREALEMILSGVTE